MGLDKKLAKCKTIKKQEELKALSFEKEYTLLEALAEIYNFHPKKKRESQILFEITVESDDKWLRFGKNYSKFDKDWRYMEWERYCPCFGQEEKHFVPNLMTSSFAQNYLRYSAQQGEFKIMKIYDSRIDTEWHNCKDNRKE